MEIKSFKDTVKNKTSGFTVGGDPEFEMIRSGTFISARDLIGSMDLFSKIGTDGNSSILELRPDPSPDKNNMILNFKSLLTEFYEKYPDVKICGIGDKYPLGHHIHLSTRRTKEIVGFLDTSIGLPTLSLNSSARKESGFSGLSNTELKNHGFEYRSATGIWAHPQLLSYVADIIFALHSKDSIRYRYGDAKYLFNNLGLNYNKYKSIISFLQVKRNRLDVLGNWGIGNKCRILSYTRTTSLLKSLLHVWRPEVPVLIYGLVDEDPPYILDYFIDGTLVEDTGSAPSLFAENRAKTAYYDHYIYLGLSYPSRTNTNVLEKILYHVDDTIANILKSERKKE